MSEHKAKAHGRRRIAALLAIAAYIAAIAIVIADLGDVISALGITLVALAAASVTGWFALTRRGVIRLVNAVLTVLLLIAPIVAMLAHAVVIDVVLVVAFWALATVLARAASGVDAESLRTATPPGVLMPAPQHPVLLMNPWSGGGKVEKFHLEDEARRLGIEPVVLQRGDDLETLARDAVVRGADALGMAGGDGSQAIVAGVAMEHDLPYVCIPAGTRNHLALDLGVDRDDVVGSLDAFVEGYERRIDLGLVNGRVFVNNVSLGVYAEIVQSDAYRDQKLKTAGDMIPELFGPGSQKFDFDLESTDGPIDDACMVLVSNNVYELERLAGFGTRVRIDDGMLGVVAVEVRNASDVAQLVTLEVAGRVGSVPRLAPLVGAGARGALEPRHRGRRRRRGARTPLAVAVRDRAGRAAGPRREVGARGVPGACRTRHPHRRAGEGAEGRVRPYARMRTTSAEARPRCRPGAPRARGTRSGAAAPRQGWRARSPQPAKAR